MICIFNSSALRHFALDEVRPYFKHDRKLPGADSMKTSIFGRAAFTGETVTAKGGAVRAHNRWYKLNFDCTVTADQMKATAFSYEVGAEIPQDKWEDLGLW